MDPGTLAPEHLLYTVDVDAITWRGHRLRCPQCGAARTWRLHLQRLPWTVGEQAWARCAADHHVTHPLIYPQMVHTLITWSGGDDPADGLGDVGDLHEALRAIAWQPHSAHWADSDYSEELPRIFYRSWSSPPPMPPHWWDQHWPELVQAAQARG
ncbi:hypothetical protein ABZU75_43880 [Streptosporangium sp. NPDC005286]|uniref:hypothetical protein n=1 Tax=Streptosporangium sp. NPDC005286 TaxID=3154463 RepID=UPI0033B787CB